jgi:hypothetical protein
MLLNRHAVIPASRTALANITVWVVNIKRCSCATGEAIDSARMIRKADRRGRSTCEPLTRQRWLFNPDGGPFEANSFPTPSRRDPITMQLNTHSPMTQRVGSGKQQPEHDPPKSSKRKGQQ